MSELVKDGVDRVWPEFPDQLRAISGQVAGKHSHTSASVKILFAANQIEWQYKRIAELEASLADSNEALQVMGLKLAHAEGHSANTVVGPTPGAAPACERFIKRVRDAWIASAETRLKDLRVSDLTTKQLQADAAELWARKNLHFVNEYCEGLLLQIDLLRANCSNEDTRTESDS